MSLVRRVHVVWNGDFDTAATGTVLDPAHAAALGLQVCLVEAFPIEETDGAAVADETRPLSDLYMAESARRRVYVGALEPHVDVAAVAAPGLADLDLRSLMGLRPEGCWWIVDDSAARFVGEAEWASFTAHDAAPPPVVASLVGDPPFEEGYAAWERWVLPEVTRPGSRVFLDVNWGAGRQYGGERLAAVLRGLGVPWRDVCLASSQSSARAAFHLAKAVPRLMRGVPGERVADAVHAWWWRSGRALGLSRAALFTCATDEEVLGRLDRALLGGGARGPLREALGLDPALVTSVSAAYPQLRALIAGEDTQETALERLLACARASGGPEGTLLDRIRARKAERTGGRPGRDDPLLRLVAAWVAEAGLRHACSADRASALADASAATLLGDWTTVWRRPVKTALTAELGPAR